MQRERKSPDRERRGGTGQNDSRCIRREQSGADGPNAEWRERTVPDVDGDVRRDVFVLFPFKKLAQDRLRLLPQRRSVVHVLPDRPPRPVVGRHDLGFVLGRVHGRDLGGGRVPHVEGWTKRSVQNKAVTLPSVTFSLFCQRSRKEEGSTNRYPVKGKHKDKYVSRGATQPKMEQEERGRMWGREA